MYSRSFYPEIEEKPTLPENYDGTAFLEAPAPQTENEAVEASAKTDGEEDVSAVGGGFLSSLGRIPFLSGFFGNRGAIKFPKIGSEEILILGTAALLFFSKEGDKECALMLLFLLFIS